MTEALTVPLESHKETAPNALAGLAAEVMEKQPLVGYRLLSCLASSERSAVFKADDLTMERPVAIKFVRPWRGRDGVVEDFFSLAGSIARLRCSGVARGLDAGRGDGDFFLAYEFLPGESLAARLARRQTGRLTEKEALRLAGDTAGILQNLFELGHPHGHLKPSNIILGDGGKPGLADIGFAWTVAWPDDAGAHLAAPDWLPPERIEGELNVDIRGDLYALGTILYAALSGAPVFRGETPEESLTMHREARPVPLHKVDPKISPDTSGLVLWLLEKDRNARPRTPREFLKRLATHPLMADAEKKAGGAEADVADTEPQLS